MSNVIKFPERKKSTPIVLLHHCPKCKRIIPTFEGLEVSSISEQDKNFTVLEVTIRMQCACGQLIDLKSKVKQS